LLLIVKEDIMRKSTITRRGLMSILAGGAVLGLASACGGGTPPAQKAPATPAAPPPTPKPISPQAPAAAPSPSPGASPAPASKPAATAPAPTGKRGGALTFLRTAEQRGFNPAFLQPGSYPLHRALYNALLRYDLNLNVVPELAEKYELAKDGLSIKLDLRKGVKFHSGREFTADDVEFSVKWFTDPKHNSAVRGQAGLVKQIDKPDKHTVVLRFDKPHVGIFDLLDVMFVLDQTQADKINQVDAGTGPFKVTDFRPGELVRMTPFAEYWEKGKPLIDEYIVKPAADAQAMAVQLEAGAADVIWIPTYQDLVRFSKDSKFQTSNGAPGAFIWDIAVNTSFQHLSDKRVRQAVSYILDRERFAQTVMQGLVQPTSLPFPKSSWAYPADLEGRHKRDVDKAKQLMAAAGKAEGFEVRILTSSKTAAGHGELAQMLQANLQEINIKSRIEDVEPALLATRSQSSDFEFMTHSYGRANKDPQTLFTGAIAWYPKGSWTKFESADYSKLLDEAGSTVDRDQRKPIYRKICELLLDESFTIPICEQPRAFVYRSNVRDFQVSLDNIPYAGDVWLDR
jgi:peptide/nickel transport system substrate-binding protein